MAWPTGCSEASSTAPASRRTSSESAPSVITSSTVIVPVVSVPVLSSARVRIRPAVSMAWALRTRTPSSAPRPTAASRAVGVARPSTHGHATTRTATAALQADAAGSPAPSQKPSVATATAITHGTNTAAIRSASRCAPALVACAWLTSRVICASRVSAPTWVALITRRPLMFTVAPVTGSPGPTSAGIDSPVTSDASTAEPPSATIPSVPIFSPGRTTNRSPAWSSPAGILCSVPSRSTATVLAPRAASALSARPDRSRARASRYRPASTAAVTPAAASRYSVSVLAWPKVKANDIFIPVAPAPPNSSAYTDQQNDAPTPTLTRVSMVAAPWPSPYQAARYSGQAPHVATGIVPAAGSPTASRGTARPGPWTAR